jgi:uncharacterized protein involved in outer membrane biogenesis
MARAWRWILGVVLGLVLLAAVALAAAWRWAGSDDFRQRAAQLASQGLGVPVQLGRIAITVWPLPAVALHDVRVGTQPPLVLQQIDARPAWRSLLAGSPRLDALVVREATLPQQGLVALAAALQKDKGSTSSGAAVPLPRAVVLDGITWVDAAGQKLTVDARVLFEDQPLPVNATAKITHGRFAGAALRLDRAADAWQLQADIGGGRVTGPLRLQPLAGGRSRFSAELATENVEVSALTAPSKTLTGRLQARTTMEAQFKDPAELVDALRTQTRFTVRQAVIHGIDLAQAVRTLGMSRSGQTTLDTLTGQVATQGKVVHLTNLVANSGALAATGNVTLSAERQLNGRANVSLTAGALGAVAGVPLTVAGTLDAPSVTPAGVTLPGSQVAKDVGDKVGKGLNSLKGLFGR